MLLMNFYLGCWSLLFGASGACVLSEDIDRLKRRVLLIFSSWTGDHPAAHAFAQMELEQQMAAAFTLLGALWCVYALLNKCIY